MKVIFTKHAKGKFKKLIAIGVIVFRKDVLTTVKNPDHLDIETDSPKVIASRKIDEKHVLRVVFKEEDGIITIITFYPAKKGRYYEN